MKTIKAIWQPTYNSEGTILHSMELVVTMTDKGSSTKTSLSEAEAGALANIILSLLDMDIDKRRGRCDGNTRRP